MVTAVTRLAALTPTTCRTGTGGPGGAAGRLTRAAVFAAVCVSVTALGHALMSPDALPGWALGGAFAAVAAAAWRLTDRERGVLATCGASVVTQLALHAGFTASQTMAGPGSAPPAGHHMSGVGMASTHSGHAETGLGSWAEMAAAHSVAGLLCGLWLWRGEVAAFCLGRALAAFFFSSLDLAVRGPSPLPRHLLPTAVALPLPRPRLPLLRHVVSRRGPPARPRTV